MERRRNILIVEPSSIIRCGIVTMLQRMNIPNITLSDSNDLTNLSSLVAQNIPDLLIVNSTTIGGLSLSTIRSNVGNENLKLISLQSMLIDQNSLQNYDDTISIYDSIDTIKDKVLKQIDDRNDLANTKKELTQREKEIIVCVVKGMTNKQIAQELILSSHTIIAHRRNIANKLQIHSPSGLTIYAIVNKLVNITDIQNSMMQNEEVEV